MAHILIVEESTESLRLLQSALKGHRLVCTRSPARALSVMKTMSFDMLVAPVYLDQNDVFYLVRSAHELSPLLRIILFSVDRSKTVRYATRSIQNASRQLGVYKYVLLDAVDERQLHNELEPCIPMKLWSDVPITNTVVELE